MTDSTSGNPVPLDPEVLHQISFSFMSSRVLSAGLQLGVFSHLAAGKSTAQEVAQAAGASERGTRMLLDALVACQLLAKKDARYELIPLAARFLVRESPDYLGLAMEQEREWKSWGHLTEAIRSGQPLQRVEAQERAEQFFPLLVRTLHVLHRDRARQMARALGVGNSRKGLRAIDIACGSGVWGIAVAEADPDARVTAQDFPAMLAVAREYLKRHDVEKQFDFLAGDLNEVDFGADRFDLALLGNIVHSEGEESSRKLFERLYRALRPGGRVVLIEMIPNDERTGPPFPIFFALNMLLNTERGDTFTLAEYTRWLQQAGFARVETADIGSPSPLVVGWKD